MTKVLTVLGTRPEIIKLSPLLPLLEERFDHVLVHSGQHYSYVMDGIFFEELHLPPARYTLEIGSGRHGEQVGRLLIALEDVLEREQPDVVVVQGDTNTTLGGALAATKRGIPVAHVEAGCRSFNWEMPEEINRVLVDRCARWLFAPDARARSHLLAEGLPESRICVVGSTAIDACLRNAPLAEKRSTILERLGLTPGDYIFLTIHRAENTRPERLGAILSAVQRLAADHTFMFAVHPRTRAVLPAGMHGSEQLRLIEPVGYLDALCLTRHAKAVMTDSGGLQEEAAALGTPALILRRETEWMEYVEAGINTLIGIEEDEIVRRARELLDSPQRLAQARQAGRQVRPGAAQRIVDILEQTLADHRLAASWLQPALGSPVGTAALT